MLETILSGIAQQGPLGLVCVLLIIGYREARAEVREARAELAAVQKERIDDADETRTILLQNETRIADTISNIRALRQSERPRQGYR